MKSKLILSIDIGTSAIKVGLFSVAGELIKVITKENPLIFIKNGKVEQNPALSLKIIIEAVNQLIAVVKNNEIGVICLTVQRGTIIALESNGRHLDNFVVWMDKRGLPIVDQIKQIVSKEEYYKISGHPLSYITGLSKILWYKHNMLDLWEKINILAPPDTYFLKWLGCDDFVCAHSSGTYFFPFDILKKTWSKFLLDKFNFPSDKLPKLASSVEVVGTISKKAAKELGISPGIPIVTAGGDGQAAAAGCGVINEGLCMINIGTGCGIQTYLPDPLFDSNLIFNCAAHVVPEAWEMEGHTQSSGATYKWFKEEFGGSENFIEEHSLLNAYDLMAEQASLAPPGCNGLIFLPTLNGSTAPILDEHARGILIGLSLHHKRNHVIRSVLEGISLEIRWMLDALEKTGASISEIRLVGGGSKNKYWNQIHADVLNRSIKILDNSDAALIGAAICGALAIDEYSDFAEASKAFIKTREIVEPRKKFQSVYDAAYENYQQIFKVMRENGIFHNLQRKDDQ